MAETEWIDLGPVETLRTQPLQQLMARRTRIALTYKDGQFSAISGVCNHVGGPLGDGDLDGDYVVCPWHYWKFHCRTGLGEPGYEGDAVPVHDVEIRDDHVYVNLTPRTRRTRIRHAPHPLARTPQREDGPIRVAGISTTAMTASYPRYSTSDALLEIAIDHAKETLACETQLIRLNDLAFRACEGFYSKSARACTWPCSITQMDPMDQLDRVYEAFVHWADVILVATPIRWGAASSLYYKMVERMNCIQNQETIANRHLMKNKVAAFIITGGQDNIQAVAGQMLGFFAEVGCQFAQFPYIAHSRGWSAEDMANNVRAVQRSQELREGARGLVERSVDMAKLMITGQVREIELVRGGRKAHELNVQAEP
ncbi:Rieske 2Fe-2S domain-containing protein [Candidatus Entotheonella palauensis]|uniref:Rieske 2Fe-2S domain-containing protein n=1 Tax=Candidatus Entotheonella palauensis TaxID=93172 RepID=UPI000B7E8792|nr:Rieske 2Fe-2S domain-containing protein [Candidatus Entotheonella palauensis]